MPLLWTVVLIALVGAACLIGGIIAPKIVSKLAGDTEPRIQSIVIGVVWLILLVIFLAFAFHKLGVAI